MTRLGKRRVLPVSATPLPVHVGIIPDGNRRFAMQGGISKAVGYRCAADKALELLGWCLEVGIRHVSAFGVSQENIALRPIGELRSLHAALAYFGEKVRLLPDVALHVFGDPNSLPHSVPERRRLVALRERGPDEARLIMHLGVNYSGVEEIPHILRAARQQGLDNVIRRPDLFGLSANIPAVDLVVRTGGQRRLSGFLPLHTAYAELWFTDTLWPAFGHQEFLTALDWYARQERRFGE